MDIDFNDIDAIKSAGFHGFQKIRSLLSDFSNIPKEKGIYFILYTETHSPDFLPTGTGGHFKGQNPNITMKELKSHWVNNTIVIYIGKAGGTGSSATIQSRLKQYLKFGQGRNIGHWGGRLIWQIRNSGDLFVCWKTLPDKEPRDVERELIQMFKSEYGKRPFANLSD